MQFNPLGQLRPDGMANEQMLGIACSVCTSDGSTLTDDDRSWSEAMTSEGQAGESLRRTFSGNSLERRLRTARCKAGSEFLVGYIERLLGPKERHAICRGALEDGRQPGAVAARWSA